MRVLRALFIKKAAEFKLLFKIWRVMRVSQLRKFAL